MDEQKAAQKRLDHQASGYDLHQILSELKESKESYLTGNVLQALTDQDLGLVYSALVTTMPRNALVSVALNQQPDRSIRKRFQEQSRIQFYRLFQNLTVGEKEFTDLRGIYEEMLLSPLKTEPQPETIEYCLTQALEQNLPFSAIGQALCQGAQIYFNEKKRVVDFDTRYKLFLEYNRILEELNHLI